LREDEKLPAEGHTIAQACQQIAVSEYTYYKWRQCYGSMRVDEATRLTDLERENQQLRKLVADLALDKRMLKEVSRGNALAPGQATPGSQTSARKVRCFRTSRLPCHRTRQIQPTLSRKEVRFS